MATPPKSVRLPRDIRRRQLIDSASRLFSELGYYPTAMDQIAEDAGVTKPVLYQHFDSKEDLYLAVMERQADDLLRFVSEAMDVHDTPRDRVSHGIDAYFEFVSLPGSTFRLISESDPVSDRVMAKVRETEWRCAQLIAPIIQRDTGLDQADAELIAIGVTGIARTTASYWAQRRDTMSRERAADHVKRLVWKGLKSFGAQDQIPAEQQRW